MSQHSKDTSARKVPRYRRSMEEAEGRILQLTPMNEKQRLYLDALQNSPQVIVCGCSGTGKTYMAARHAANLYLTRQINKIVITRPNVSTGPSLGALPGDKDEKFAPWAAPVLDVLVEMLGKGKVATDIKNGNIELAPLSMMRGRSFKNAFVILDEAQNTTVAELKMFLTRIGEGCHVVVNGDVKQTDLKGDQSGLAKAIHIAKAMKMDVPVIEFGIEDIVRSDICKQWIIGFESAGL